MEERTWVRYNKSRILGSISIGIGVVVLFLGWLGAARGLYPAEQLPYLISGGLGGLVFVGLGALLWLSADLQDEWTKLDLIEAALSKLAEQQTGSSTSVDIDGVPVAGTDAAADRASRGNGRSEASTSGGGAPRPSEAPGARTDPAERSP